jgi:hypothetical protein
MFRSDKGQTVLEYLIVATLILAGIVIGGPFLVRSVSGHFRLLEDSTSDSVGEDIRQASAPAPPAGSCVCNNWFKGACGNNDPCSPSQRLYQRGCNPANCDIQQECLAELDCCNDPIIVQCGTILNLPGRCTGPRPLPKVTPSGGGAPVDVFDPAKYVGICPESTALGTQLCKLWERLYSISCGAAATGGGTTTTTYYACKDVSGETLNCGPECWDGPSTDGTPLAGSSPCAGDETSPSNLPTEIDYRVNGFTYNSSTYQDVPRRPVGYWDNVPIEMYGAPQVIITYFDPTIATTPPTAAELCAPNEANYGTANCHRCSDTRRCEFACPIGYCPKQALVKRLGSVDNATCEPCCPAGTVYHGSCGPGSCQTSVGTCSATECTRVPPN